MRYSRLLVLWALIVLGCSPMVQSGGSYYHGRVVDAETEKPLEGAVVVVLWYKKPAISMDGPQDLHKAVEALTDAEGKFSVDASPGIDANPFTYVLKEPWIVIFKPGYGSFPIGYGNDKAIKVLDERLYAKQEVEVKLPRLKSKNQLRKFTIPEQLGILSSVPYEEIPNLIRLLNSQAQSLGLPPIGKP